ncbi:MAG: histidine kinase [Flavobacteriales bacterium]|nr:histidine kinase [Flavobacteriales bacterium]
MQFRLNRRWTYWITQILAWGAFGLVIIVWSWSNDQLTQRSMVYWALWAFMGLAFSHWLRGLIRRKEWLDLNIGWVIPRLVLASTLLGTLAMVLLGIIHDLFLREYQPIFSGKLVDVLEPSITWAVLLFGWTLAYFAFHYFQRGRREEIRNLRLEAANRDNQLSNLRSQLNPHFMFNALNGIRALVDENPEQAKRAITQLSAILRNAMTTVKRRTVPLGEELDIVKAYLALEAMRFEERLQVSFDIDPELTRVSVPPMLLQTLVENAVKHGIAKLTKGGEVRISVHRGLNGLVMMVANSGTYEPGVINGTGIGLRNTRKRLGLLYGPNAALRIEERNGMVVTEVELPEEK